MARNDPVEAFPKEIRLYETPRGRVPFSDWMDSLEGQEIYEIIMLRLDTVERGSLGKTKRVGDGVSEMIFDYEEGYRIYYGLIGSKGDIVVLLNGGTKRTQDADIKLAKDYWNDKEFNHGE
jgi:putative addiction module killer protein